MSSSISFKNGHLEIKPSGFEFSKQAAKTTITESTENDCQSRIIDP